ncbi:MAG: redoxin domain-containing protein [Pyrinomonadaceae bacterium]
MRLDRYACRIFAAVSITLAFTAAGSAQLGSQAKSVKAPTVSTSLPVVSLIDASMLKERIRPHGKPLLVNFWATWCEPCREEFPDLVRINADYKDRINIITISLDEVSEIGGSVPKFLFEMKAEMPSYLLKTPDDDAAIGAVSKDWRGGLPFTILFAADGSISYQRMGKFQPAVLRTEILRLIAPAGPQSEPQPSAAN